MVSKQWWFDFAEALNRFRVFPRLMMAVYMYMFVEACVWFMGLPTPSPSQAAFLSTIIGAGAAWFGLYVNSGPGKNNANSK